VYSNLFSNIGAVVGYKKAWENANGENDSDKLANIETAAKTYYDKLPKFYYDKLKGMKASDAQNWYNSLPRFATEGFTGTWSGSNGKLAMVDPEEFILHKDTVTNLLHGNLQSLLPRLNMQNFISPIKAPNLAMAGGGSMNFGNININVDHIANDMDINDVATKVVNKIAKLNPFTNQSIRRK
jgi:hypothetical protein